MLLASVCGGGNADAAAETSLSTLAQDGLGVGAEADHSMRPPPPPFRSGQRNVALCAAPRAP